MDGSPGIRGVSAGHAALRRPFRTAATRLAFAHGVSATIVVTFATVYL